MAKKNRRNMRGVEMDTEATARPAGEVKKPSNKRKSIGKLSRKQKVRKLAKVQKAEACVDRASAKSVRDANKLNRRITAKTLW